MAASDSVTVGGFSFAVGEGVSSVGSNSFSLGKAGDVSITAGDVHIFDGGIIGAAALGPGPSGDVTVDAQTVLIEGTSPGGISAVTSTAFSSGDAGDVTVNTSTLTARDGGSVTSSGVAQGNGGDLIINATESILVSGATGDLVSQLRSSINIPTPFFQFFLGLEPTPSGNAGSLAVNTPYLKLEDGGRLSVRNEGVGDAGGLFVSADRLNITDGAGIFSSTQSGEGGNIQLSLNDILFMRNGGVIDSEAFDVGNGGNILIQAPVIIGIENSDIVASAVTGNGGNINISTQGILGLIFREQLTSENDITASSEFGVDGSVDITNFGGEFTTSLEDLSDNLEDRSNQITEGCGTGANEFVMTGRGGLPQGPIDLSAANNVWADMRDLSNFLGNARSSRLFSDHFSRDETLAEATAWHTNANGQVELVTLSTSQPNWQDSVTCSSTTP